MDGNGRWAESRGLPRARGHQQGAETLRAVARRAAELGVRELTGYALSTENLLRRPAAEVEGLMELLRHSLHDERAELDALGVRLRFIGRLGELPAAVQEDLARAERESSGHGGMVLRLAINYGSRSELLDAVRSIAEECRRGALDPAEIAEEDIAARLYDPSMPDPDLLVRTAGEQRISNFLLWQISYSELYFAPCPWPEFGPDRLEEAIEAYRARRRKYGGIAPARGREPETA
jgi:undecaprenyl diphosphate synthase